jgi:Transglycosylase SLT domain
VSFEKKGWVKSFGAFILLFGLWSGLLAWAETPRSEPLSKPVPPSVPALSFSELRTAPLEIAKVFGRSPGCQDADSDLIFATSDAALRTGLDPKIAAATVAVESGCNSFAISNRGALGLMQVRAISWKDKYDFSGKINLLNRKDNLQVGTEILSGLIKQFGVAEGVRRYNGVGQGCESCDGQYVSKILILAGKK